MAPPSDSVNPGFSFSSSPDPLRAAMAHHQAGRLREAEAIYNQVLARKPDHAQALYLLGILCQSARRHEDAVGFLTRAAKISPRMARAFHARAASLIELGRWELAAQSAQRAIDIDPALAEAYCNLGNALHSLGRLDAALAAFHRALEIKPALIRVQQNIAAVQMDQHNFAAAAESFRRLLAGEPTNAAAMTGLGSALEELGDYSGAIARHQEAVRLDPNLRAARMNLGLVCLAALRLPEAIEQFQALIARMPQDAEAHLSLSLAYLLQGDFERGLPEYEFRADARETARTYKQPRWNGGPLSGTLLLYGDQGAGDTIQFLRYVPQIMQRLAGPGGSPAKIIIGCQKSLQPLVERLPGVAGVVTDLKEAPPFDAHFPLLSLPLLFATTLKSIPSAVPYIHVDPALAQMWRRRVAEAVGATPSTRKIGLVWAGNPKHRRDRERSIPVDLMVPLGCVSNTRFFSLQVGGSGASSFPGLIDFTSELTDFAQTAALVAALDLVISVDTSVAHLAGALGIPVWTLLHYQPDWRWMLNRADSPWYPTMRLFRQRTPGDWKGVIDEVAHSLA